METEAPAGYFSDVKPFFMTIPEITGSDSASAKYNYKVEAFPKNKDVLTGAIKKTVDQNSFVGPGQVAKYTITAATNTVATKDESGWVAADFTDYAIFDDAPNAAYSDIPADDAAAAKVVNEVKVGDKALQPADYSVSVIKTATEDKFSKGLAAEHTRIIVKFNDNGLAEIAKAKNADENVTVSMNVSLTLKTDLPGDTVTNISGYVPGYNPDKSNGTTPDPVIPPTPDPDDPSVEQTKFGNFQIKKVAAEDTNKTLKGAEFLAFADPSAAKACADDKTRAADKCANKESVIKLESGEDGLTEKKKVKLNSKFYVVETKAPKNYVLSGEVTEVTATADSETTPIEIENVLSADSGSWFNLPSTGAIGVGIFALLGAGLVAGGTAMHMRSRRRENA